MIDLMYMREMD